MFDWLTSLFDFNFDWNTFIFTAGTDPFSAMWYVFIHGGWILIVLAFLWMIQYGWLQYVQIKCLKSKEWILLRISVPRMSEQTPKAAENMFAVLAGAHTSFSWYERWFQGKAQSPLAVEIASLEGAVSFYVHAERRMRDLVEAAIYAQYPDAEIQEVEDYARTVPSVYPDEEWDLWGVEMVPVKPDPYPIRTYMDFEDKVSGEFKDPVATMLENFSRIGPGEQVWYQIVLTPTDQKEARHRAEKLIDQIKGVKKPVKKTMLDQVVDFPLAAARTAADVLVGSHAEAHKKDEKKEAFPRMFALSPGERTVLEAIERKAAKIGFMCKIRFVYVAKKNVKVNTRAVHPFIGAIKQTNTFDMQALKPDTKKVGMSSQIWFFKERRNNRRKHHLVAAYRSRSSWAGDQAFLMTIEELATLWHFPILQQVKAPQLRHIEAKKSEAPPNLPFA